MEPETTEEQQPSTAAAPAPEPAAPANPSASSETSQPSPAVAADVRKGYYDATPPPKGTYDPNQARSGFGHIYHNLLDVMGGKVDHHYTVDPKSGKMMDKPTPRTPGSQWAHIVTAALTGLAASEGTHGPSAGLVALGKGGVAGVNLDRQEDATARKKATDAFSRGQQADEMTMRKAQAAREQQESLLKAQDYSNKFKRFNYDFTQITEHDQQELADRWNNRQAAGVQPLVIDGRETPEFDTLKEANDFAMNPANTKGVIGGFMTRIDIDPNTHKFVISQVPQDKKQWQVEMPDGTKGFFYGTANDYLGLQNKQAELKRDKAQIVEINQRIASMGIDLKDKRLLDQASGNWRKSLQAAGNDPEKAVQYMKQNYPKDAAFLQDRELDMLAQKGGYPIFSGAFPEQKDPFGAQLAVKEHKDYTKEMAAFQKEYVLPANGIEKSYQMSDIAFQDYMKARAKGKTLSSGAASMVMLSNHLNTTFGQVKGARITKDMIHEHLGARSISDEMEVAINRLVNGDALSFEQWKAFHDLITESRNATWKLVADNALNQGLPRNFMPRGNGRVIDDDPATAQLFYQLAEENPQRARQAAQYFGWKLKKGD